MTKEEQAAYKHKWYVEHKEQHRANHRKWMQEHPDYMINYLHQYYRDHTAEHRVRTRRWAAEHRVEDCAREQRRRAIKKQTVVTLTPEQAKTLMRPGCFFCGSKDQLTIAHDIPVSKRGPTTLANVFCACRSCNAKMHTKALAETISQLEMI